MIIARLFPKKSNYFNQLNSLFIQIGKKMDSMGLIRLFSLWTLVESELRNRRVPTEEIFADLLYWCGGALLVVPGLLTDALGLIVFIPVVRYESIRWLRKRIQKSLGLPPMN